MAEQESIPIQGGPGPEGKGQWCIYHKVGVPIGIGKVVGEFFEGEGTCWVQYSELPIAEPEPFPTADVSMFNTPQEAISEFSVMANIHPERVVRAFQQDFPSWRDLVCLAS